LIPDFGGQLVQGFPRHIPAIGFQLVHPKHELMPLILRERQHTVFKLSNAHHRVILDRMAGESAELRRLTEEARVNAAVAQLIYEARNKAGLSQSELAERIGTKQSVISRLEDADYEGHSLSMLQRIAAAMGQCVEIRFLARRKAVSGRRSNAAILEPVG
jgi:DNA-binding XRE family transcriptional regulator